MSQTEFHSGQAYKVQFTDETLEEKVQTLLDSNIVIDCADIENKDISGEGFIFLQSTEDFYLLKNHFSAGDEDQYLEEATMREDGGIDFMLQFYNGGAGFEEVFEDAISKLEQLEAVETEDSLTEEQIEDNERVANIIDQEGVGYAVGSYCNSDDFKDPHMVKLWDNAQDAITKLENYVANFQ